MLFAAILPNLPVKGRVGNGLVAAMPWNSPETIEQRKIDGFDRFMSSFTDTFGRSVQPSVVVLNEREVRAEQWFPSIVAFRNVLALSSIPKAWAKSISVNQKMEGLYFGDYFHIYPYEIGVEGTIATFNPATHGVSKLTDARGQTFPGLHTFFELEDFWDIELFSALLARWTDRFVVRPIDESWSSTALFRSLEMAFRASLMPFTNQGSIDDYGAQVGLWVSACEVLAHDGAKSSASVVSKRLLKPCVFDNDEFTRKLYPYKQGNKTLCLTLVQALYYQLNDVRNAFIHGNEREEAVLIPWKDENRIYHPLPMVAALVYKCALLTHLGCWARRSPLDAIGMGEFVERRDMENALYQFRPGKSGGYDSLTPSSP